MNDIGRSNRERQQAALPTAGLSPLVQLLPTGYRNIQPLQKGQGWHSNGRQRRVKPSSSGATASPIRSPDRVVFPAIPGYYEREQLGPAESILTDQDDRQEEEQCDLDPDSDCTNGLQTQSDKGVAEATFRPAVHRAWQHGEPSISMPTTPTPPSAPRRPSSSDGTHGNASGFRTRAFANSLAGGSNNSGSSRPTTPSAASVKKVNDHSEWFAHPVLSPDDSQDVPQPDPALMQQLWQEFTERTQHHKVDKDDYHRKMQRKYNERKMLRDHLAQIELELAEVKRERDDARLAAAKMEQRLALSGIASSVDQLELEHKSPSPLQSPSPRLSPRATSMVLVDTEKSFKLERALATTKHRLVDTEAQLAAQREEMQRQVDVLKAKLALDQTASTELARQLHEALASFKRTADELVDTRAELERARDQHSRDLKQAQQGIYQLMTDRLPSELQNQAEQLVRELRKRTLQHKLESLSEGAPTVETDRLRRAIETQQQQLERDLLSGSLNLRAALKCEGIPGILQRGTVLYHGTRAIGGQVFLLQVLYEDSATSNAGQDSHTSGFSMHFIAFEPGTSQHDYLTFHCGDIQRLSLDEYVSKHEYEELAERLLRHIHAGYKNNQLFITETPISSQLLSTSGLKTAVSVGQASSKREEIVVYRGTRFLPCYSQNSPSTDFVMTELTVNEVDTLLKSELWWLEIHALLVGTAMEQTVHVLKLSHHQLLSVWGHYASSRPSENMDWLASEARDREELMAVHEALLEPILKRLRVDIVESQGVQTLRLGMTGMDILDIEHFDQNHQHPDDTSKLNIMFNAEVVNPLSVSNQLLDHRGIVNVNGVFYCARFQEVYKDERTLEVTLDDPETLVNFATTIQERELAAIAAYLHAIKAVGDDFSGCLRHELPLPLHQPLSRLLKKHIAIGSSAKDNQSELVVSFETLFAEVAATMQGSKPSTEDLERPSTALPGGRVVVMDSVIPGLNTTRVHAFDCNQLSDERIRSVVMQMSDPRRREGLWQARRGARYRAPATELALVRIYRGFAGFHGVTVAVFPLTTAGSRPRKPALALVGVPLGSRVFELLQLEPLATMDGGDLADGEHDEIQPERDQELVAVGEATVANQPLDHRGIVNIAGVFYCTRFRELWDGEVLLEVTLDDPESLAQYTGTLHEQELVIIARHLVETGDVEAAIAAQVQFGLPPDLHQPLARLLKKHATVVDSIPGQLNSPRLSFQPLFDEIQFSIGGCGDKAVPAKSFE